MDPKLKAILQKAKEIDIKARKYDSVDTSVLENSVNGRLNNNGGTLHDQMGTTQSAVMSETTNTAKPNINPKSENYNQRVKESKLPPEIMKAMLDNPIPQPDMPGTFSMDEESIREINPNYGKPPINETIQNVEMVKGPTQKGFDTHVLRKMIAEEIAKALPSIVERYFDKKMIKENIEVLKSLKIKRKTTNNRK
tara:strand:- start:56542 stop:57126 length:585 start_codon:yes stop_codon:yes gene_type:complete